MKMSAGSVCLNRGFAAPTSPDTVSNLKVSAKSFYLVFFFFAGEIEKIKQSEV